MRTKKKKKRTRRCNTTLPRHLHIFTCTPVATQHVLAHDAPPHASYMVGKGPTPRTRPPSPPHTAPGAGTACSAPRAAAGVPGPGQREGGASHPSAPSGHGRCSRWEPIQQRLRHRIRCGGGGVIQLTRHNFTKSVQHLMLYLAPLPKGAQTHSLPHRQTLWVKCMKHCGECNCFSGGRG